MTGRTTRPDTGLDVSSQPAPVSFFYMFSLVLFSFGTSAVSFCSAQVLPMTVSKFTSNTALIGFVISLQALNQLWVTPYAAWKSDRIWTRIGRRKPLVLIMTPMLAISVAAVPHVPVLWLLVLLVFVLQMGEDAELAVMHPSISDSVPDRQRPLATSMWQMMLAGSAFVMGRYAMKLMDRAEHWPYTIAGLTVVVTGCIFLKAMRERYVPPRPRERFRPFSYGRDIYRVREHLLIYVICFFQPLFVLVSSAYFPLLARETLHLKPSQFGAAVAWGGLTTMLVSIPCGYLFTRWKRRRAVCVAASLFALAPLTFGFFFMRSAAGMAAFFVMQQLMFNVYRTNFFPLVMEYTTPKSVATVLGFTTAVNGVVRFTMIPLAGLLVDLVGKNYRLPLLGGYVGVAVTVALLLMMRPPEKVRPLIEEGEV